MELRSKLLLKHASLMTILRELISCLKKLVCNILMCSFIDMEFYILSAT